MVKLGKFVIIVSSAEESSQGTSCVSLPLSLIFCSTLITPLIIGAGRPLQLDLISGHLRRILRRTVLYFSLSMADRWEPRTTADGKLYHVNKAMQKALWHEDFLKLPPGGGSTTEAEMMAMAGAQHQHQHQHQQPPPPYASQRQPNTAAAAAAAATNNPPPPAGWERARDPNTGASYLFSRTTGERRWESNTLAAAPQNPPTPGGSRQAVVRPDGTVVYAVDAAWVAVRRPGMAREYYVHRATRETRWEHPLTSSSPSAQGVYASIAAAASPVAGSRAAYTSPPPPPHQQQQQQHQQQHYHHHHQQPPPPQPNYAQNIAAVPGMFGSPVESVNTSTPPPHLHHHQQFSPASPSATTAGWDSPPTQMQQTFALPPPPMAANHQQAHSPTQLQQPPPPATTSYGVVQHATIVHTTPCTKLHATPASSAASHVAPAFCVVTAAYMATYRAM